MATLKLKRSEWQRYFDQVAKGLPSMRVGMSILGDEIGAQLETEDSALLGMSYDSKDEVFEIATSSVSHRVERPREIYIHEKAGTLASVEVVAQDGTKQIIELRPLPSLPAS